MEGRVPPTAGDANYESPLFLHSPPLQLPPSPDNLETYVVQIPREQIYRIPPPENAKIVENHRNPNNKKPRCGGNKYCLWILISLALLAAVVGITVTITNAFFSPKMPEFSVTKVLVKRGSSRFEISLKAKNPNERMGVSYENGGDTSLSFKQKKIARGKYPTLSQDAKESKSINLNLAGSNAALLREFEKSMNRTTSKTPVSLSLTINVPIKLKGLIDISKDMTVTCDFKVISLASGTKISSQECDAKF